MFYENEFKFLCETLKKCHIKTAISSPSDYMSAVAGEEADDLFAANEFKNKTIQDALGNIEHKTLYRMTDSLGRCYICLLLYEKSADIIFSVGPYLDAPLSSKRLLELGEELGVSPKSQRYFEEYYMSIPVLNEDSPVFVMIDTFCEAMWGSPSFAIVDIGAEHQSPASPINEPTHSDDSLDDIIVSMRAMETRYKYENELMNAVSLGQIQKEPFLLTAFSEQAFEKRLQDPIRNRKNYGIIMNTLLRKAAENGGVHPLYIDRLSSEFATKIEKITSVEQSAEVMRDMFRRYCRLVRKHSVKDYSRVVRETILLIDSDLAANLTLSSLAENQNISAGYLSSVFKKETGKTVSEFIREKRINHATHLLLTTHLQIQTIALHCGIVDVQYFSKIFKKQTGKTPKEYRESMKSKKL